MSKVSILDALPESVLIHALTHCEVETLFACKRACCLLERIIRTDLYLQYKIELAINGMVDGPSTCPLAVSERLAKLRECSAQFRSGSYQDTGFEYSFQRWPTLQEMRTDGWECHVGIGASISYAIVKPPQRVIDICAPPGFTGERKMREWSIPLDLFSSGDVVAVSADLSQDLLVIAQKMEGTYGVAIHLRSLSDPANKHPLAIESMLHASSFNERFTDNPRFTCISAIQIHGPYVALKLEPDHGHFSYIEVWDWRAGRQVWSSHFNDDASFTFLDNEHIIVADHKTLQVFRFASPGRATDGLKLPAGLRFYLQLPRNVAGVRIQPTPIPSPPSPDEPFWPDPDLRVFVVATGDVPATLIPYSTLRALAGDCTLHSPDGNGGSREFKWEEWGPGRALVLRAPYEDYDWAFRHCYPYGSRVPMLLGNEEHRSEDGDVIVYDLNPWAARYAQLVPFPRSKYAYEDVEDPRKSFGTQNGKVPHVAIHGPCVPGVGFAQSSPAVAMNHNGFTAVFTTRLSSTRFVGSITSYN